MAADGPFSVVKRHYERLAPGADWDALRRDYAPDARVVRLDADGRTESRTAAEWFAESAPLIDSKQAFEVRLLGSRTRVYDHLAAVWLTVEIVTQDPGAEARVLQTVEQVSLVLDEDASWRISQIQYQAVREDWPPAREHRGGAYAARSPFEPELGFRVSNL